jgi:pyrroloquinoline quinone (PQQ) biosynthesis protein C
MGLEGDGPDHPALLERLLRAAGLGHAVRELHAQAQEDLNRLVARPWPDGTLRSLGLALLVEVMALEFMLGRLASRCVAFLQRHRGLSLDALGWFVQYAEPDAVDAEEGLTCIAVYLAYYRFEPEEAEKVARAALRENLFVKRYFGECALPAPLSDC